MDERPPPLQTYRARRDPERTPEPFGGARLPGAARFVVQQHAARRMHYDLRLEMTGVLKSWAVPRGPSIRPEEKRLAVQVEDHPLEYADFEGMIPAGNYGAGRVIVWDNGWYRPVSPADPMAGLARGRLEVDLFGHKLRGRWTLVRMSGKEREWLLLKKAERGAAARPRAARDRDGGGPSPAGASTEMTERYPESVLSGLTVEEVGDPAARRARLAERLEALGAPARPVRPGPRSFMLATLRAESFSDPAWLFEVKWDGVRVLAWREGGRVELLGRSGQAITGRYPEVARALRALPVPRLLLDGEIVALDESGRPSFQRLQARMHLSRRDDVARAQAQTPVVAVLFDCLAAEGRDLRALPLAERKAILRLLVPALGVLRYGDHVAGQGQALFEAASAEGLEGIVAKRAASAYVPGRSRDWVKIKCQRRQELVVVGFTEPRGSRAHLGALHLAVHDRAPARGGRLVYAGKVGTGFDEATASALREALLPLRRPAPPFSGEAPRGAGQHWVEPRLVAEVRFAEWTEDGQLRHPAFLGLRSDKRPEECVREEPPGAPGPAAPGHAGDRAAAGRGPAEAGAAVAPRAGTPGGSLRVPVTNPDKVFWPEEGYTKADLVAYYETVAPWLLPYLADRPLVLTRYPDGIRGKSFFQKDAPAFTPEWVRTERIYSRDAGRDIDYVIAGDVETLRWVANLGTIPLHLWSARLASLDRPDWLVLDLDPKGAPFAHVVRVAQSLRRILDGIGVPAYPKTSGATGLHLLVPLGARLDHAEARTLARLLALLGVEAEPEIATVARPLRDRSGRVYVDWGQNGHGRTIVAPFSVRPLPGAPVSCPLRWSEVTARLDPARFTIRTLPPRLRRLGDPLRPVLSGEADVAGALAALEQRLGHQAR